MLLLFRERAEELVEEALFRGILTHEEAETYCNFLFKELEYWKVFLKKRNGDAKSIKEELGAMEEEIDRIVKKSLIMLVGFRHPWSEQGVIFAFGCLYKILRPLLEEYLGTSIEELQFQTIYPDLIIKGEGKELRIEFEQNSGNFRSSYHNPSDTTHF